jgi:hypothetical protein
VRDRVDVEVRTQKRLDSSIADLRVRLLSGLVALADYHHVMRSVRVVGTDRVAALAGAPENSLRVVARP